MRRFQILNNFHRKLGKIELLVTLDREMTSPWNFHQLFILTRGNYRGQYFELKFIIQNDARKSKIIFALPWSLCIWWNMKQWRSVTESLFSPFRIWKQKWQICQELWELIFILFEKLLWCSITVPNDLLLVYPYPELCAASKNDPCQAYMESGINKVNSYFGHFENMILMSFEWDITLMSSCFYS